jgi:hypothetical protein
MVNAPSISLVSVDPWRGAHPNAAHGPLHSVRTRTMECNLGTTSLQHFDTGKYHPPRTLRLSPRSFHCQLNNSAPRGFRPAIQHCSYKHPCRGNVMTNSRTRGLRTTTFQSRRFASKRTYMQAQTIEQPTAGRNNNHKAPPRCSDNRHHTRRWSTPHSLPQRAWANHNGEDAVARKV